MRLTRLPGADMAALVATLLTPTFAAAFDCHKLVVQDHKFDFWDLRGPHSVVTSEFDALANTYRNTTYTLDLCAPLQRKDNTKKECPNGTRVCAITHAIEKDDPTKDFVESVIPIAGQLGNAFEWEAERLSTSESPGDESKEGVRLVFKGGKYQKQAQRAVVELRCHHNKTGTEGEVDPEDKYTRPPEEEASVKRKRDEAGNTPSDEQDGWTERQIKKDGAALIWDRYEESTDRSEKVLYLTWYTKYACETSLDEPNASSRSWGIFTWLFVLFFLGTATYLIFGSWLNYNRYGARGWDLLPHGDTLRDIPYLFRDWTRRVLNTVQSSGSRGGYSAV